MISSQVVSCVLLPSDFPDSRAIVPASRFLFKNLRCVKITKSLGSSVAERPLEEGHGFESHSMQMYIFNISDLIDF